MKVTSFLLPAIQLSARHTCRHNHQLISDVRPHVKHTDFGVRNCQDTAFRVVLLSSDLRPSLSSDARDVVFMCSPLYLLLVLMAFA